MMRHVNSSKKRQLMWLPLLVILCSMAWLPQAAAADDRPVRIMVLGDSLSTDGLVAVQQRWTTALKAGLFEAGVQAELINVSSPALTAEKARSTLKWQLKQHRPNAVIIQLGSVDGQVGFTLRFIEENLTAIVNKVKSMGALPVLVSVKMPSSLRRDHMAKLPSVYASVAKRTKAHLVKVDLTKLGTKVQFTARDIKYFVNAAQPEFIEHIRPAIQTLAANTKSESLGPKLTPIGAVRAGNKAGTIPEWQGGYPVAGKLPATYVEGGFYTDPFAEDKPTHTISAANMQEYEQFLTAGQKALLEKNADMQLPVYITRRTAAFPLGIYESTAKNANEVKLVGTDEVTNFEKGFPFPQPESGAEAIWNHKVRYRGEGMRRYNNQAVVQPDGQYHMVNVREDIKFKYGSLLSSTTSESHVLLYFRQFINQMNSDAPQTVLLVHESVDQTRLLRRSWVFSPEDNRWGFKYARNFDYDHPGTVSNGLRYADQVDMFNGALDRYDWKLVGRKEVYIPYNSYRLNDERVQYSDVLQAKQINHANTRYELHRVWQVEATLKDGAEHALAKRVFYIDEDSWSIAAVDNYDASNQLVRYQEAHLMNYYDLPMTGSSVEVTYDLESAQYFVSGLSSEDGPQLHINTFKDNEFTPKGMQQKLAEWWPADRSMLASSRVASSITKLNGKD